MSRSEDYYGGNDDEEEYIEENNYYAASAPNSAAAANTSRSGGRIEQQQQPPPQFATKPPPPQSATTMMENAQTIQVLVRVRPLSSDGFGGESDYALGGDLGAETVVDIQSETTLAVTNADGKRTFQCAFDSVLGPFSTQTEVYRTVQGCTQSVLEGFNSTIFAYGQTGSGKV